MKNAKHAAPAHQGLSLKQLRDAVEYNINLLSNDSHYIAMDIQHDAVRVVYQLGPEVRVADFVIEPDGSLGVNGESMLIQDYANSRHEAFVTR